ncbi:MAG: NAD(P)H-dependent oxidoreductase subunit E [Deltaproteobacteria bacterium]|nr:NAD(P)H-dependent oxidoreductase subunit E [Deltaproteobacteria bacterium]
MTTQKVDKILDRWKRDPQYAIEILQDIQDEHRHLPADVLHYVADALALPVGRLYHIGTFFKAFSLKPRGEHVLEVCMGTACHVRGAPRILDALSRELEVPEGGTTKDGKFTLEPVRCLGCCAIAPVVKVGKDLHGEIQAARVKTLVKKLAEG